MESYSKPRKLDIPPSEFVSSNDTDTLDEGETKKEPLPAPVNGGSTFEEEKQSKEIERLAEENKHLRNNREMRKKYADRAYRIATITLAGWATFVILYLLLAIIFAIDGISLVTIIPVPIFITITTACTINIIAAFIAVIKGLFGGK